MPENDETLYDEPEEDVEDGEEEENDQENEVEDDEPAPEPPRVEDRRAAALEWLKENPDAVRELAREMGATKAPDDDEDEPEFTSFADVARWAKEQAVKELAQSQSQRSQVAARVRADLEKEYGSELSASQIQGIVDMFGDPNATMQAVRDAYASGMHLQYGAAEAYRAAKRTAKAPRTSAEPVGGGAKSAPSAEVAAVQRNYERATGRKLSRKDAEEYIRSGGSI